MESLPISNFEESRQSPHLDAPMAAESQQLQPSDSDIKATNFVYVPAPKGEPKVSRDEEPPTMYPQQRPSSATRPRRPGVVKRSHVEPARNARVQRRKLPTDSEPPFELPPSLVSQSPALRQAKVLQQLQQQQQMPGTYRTMYQPQQRSRNYGSSEPTCSANGEWPEDTPDDLVPQMNASYQSQIDDLYGQNARTLQQGTYPTFEAKQPVNSVNTDRIPQEGSYDLPDKPQYMRCQFGAQLQPPYEQPHPEQSGGSELSLHQQQADSSSKIPVPRLPSYESPYILTPQMECSFASPNASDVEDFDFDTYLKERGRCEE